MTVLGKHDIQRSISHGELKAHRGLGNRLAIEPASMDVHLSGAIKRSSGWEGQTVRVDDKRTYPAYESVHSERPVIESGEFVLATTQENIEIPTGLVAYLQGRSSVGRLGLFIENAGLIDPGFRGQVTLELANVEDYDIELVEGMRIGQLTFHEVKSAPHVGYSEHNGNKYNDQEGPTPSRLWEDFE